MRYSAKELKELEKEGFDISEEQPAYFIRTSNKKFNKKQKNKK